MLNSCPKCQRSFAEGDGNFCPEDATKLQPSDQVPIPADPNDPVIGATIAKKYEIRRVVADGGMGRVYEARQLDPPRRVAVKILHTDIASDPVNIERFKREAETSQMLDRAHIVDVIDFAQEKPAPGRPEGAWFLTMEYLDGDELRAVLNKHSTLPMSRVIRITSQTAIALDSAHARGAVHRDMKPDNVFLVRRPDGDVVKVLDFGSVKFTKGQDKNQKLTVMGTTIGSPYYMSPEQAKGLPDLDHRADVWALGAIVYEMTVGKVPFNAPNGPQILFKILGEEPMPPSFAKDDAPPQLDDIITRALNKKREDRFQSCGSLADGLGHAFGLAGNHLDWAKTSETDLAKQLAAAEAAGGGVSAPMQQHAPTQAQQQAPAKGMAFAMAGPGVGMQQPNYSQQQQRPMQMAPGNGGVPDDYSPVTKTPVLVYVGIAGAVVVLSGLLALFVR